MNHVIVGLVIKNLKGKMKNNQNFITFFQNSTVYKFFTDGVAKIFDRWINGQDFQERNNAVQCLQKILIYHQNFLIRFFFFKIFCKIFKNDSNFIFKLNSFLGSKFLWFLIWVRSMGNQRQFVWNAFRRSRIRIQTFLEL